MKSGWKIFSCVFVVSIAWHSVANAEILMQEDFTLRNIGENIIGTAPNIDGGPNPNPNYTGGNTYQSVYYNHELTGVNIADDTFFNNQFPRTGTALKIDSTGSQGGGPNKALVVPYQYVIQPDDVLRLTVRINSAADNTTWNNLALGFTSRSDPVVNGFGNTFIFQDNQIQHFSANVNTPFPGAGYQEGQYDAYGVWHVISIEYDASKANTSEYAYSVFVDGQEFNFPIPGAGNPALDKIGGVAFGNFYSFGANTRYISDWKLELVEDTIDGDLNGDGFVGQDDLNLILGNWGQNVEQGNPDVGDPSGDGFVGQDDLNLVLGGWGQGAPPVAAVPEPASMVLFALAGVGVVVSWRRRAARS